MTRSYEDIISSAKARQLQGQVKGQEAKAKAMGGKVKKGGPSMLSRIFDVISRPLYGVSEGYARLAETNNPVKMLEGMGKGVAGKTKTDMGDAFLRAAEADKKRGMEIPGLGKAIRENKYNTRTALGLAGDVVFDPVSYLGGGIVKAGGKAAADAAKLNAIKGVALSEKTIKAAEEASNLAKAAKAESIAKRAAAGQKVTRNVEKTIEKAGAKASKDVTRTAWKGAEATVGKEAFEAAKISAPGKVQFKFAGKKIGESEKLYNLAAGAGKAAGTTKAGKWANEAFRTGAKFPELTNKIRRESQLRGIAHAQDEMHEFLHGAKAVRGAEAVEGGFKGMKALTPHERELVTHAAEAGPVKDITKLTEKGVPVEEAVKPSSLHGVPAENGDDLGVYVDKLRELGDRRFEEEYAAGVFRHEEGPKKGQIKAREEAYRENYVPHYYKNAEGEEQAIRRINEIGSNRPGFNKVRKVESLKDAAEKGLDPHVMADEIGVKRIAASHRAIAQARYAEAVAKEYGQELGSSTARKLAQESGYRTVDSPYVSKNMVFPPHIADSFEHLTKMYKDDELTKQFLKVFDTAQNHLKFWQTAANPGHHVRNFAGDVWQNFAIGGVKNPRRYEQSLKVLTNPENFKMRAGKAMLDGKSVTAGWIEKGAKPGFTLGELEIGEKQFGKVKTWIAAKSEKREEFARMANFIEQVKKYGKDLDPASKTFAKDLDKVYGDAAAEVRRVNIDYGDVTDFERNVMKRVMPFYTWSRKNIPLQIEALALHPGRVAAIPKGTAAIQRIMGTDVGYNQEDPLTTLPKYLKEMSGVRLRGEGSGKNAIYWAAPLPFQDITKYAEGGQKGILQSVLSQVTPAARVPFEMATGKQVFSGANIKGNVPLAASQVPILNQLYNTLTGKQKPASLKTFNWATGAGISEVTQAQKSGELRRQQDSLQGIIRARKQKLRSR